MYRRVGAVVTILTCSLALAGQASVTSTSKQLARGPEPRQVLVLDSYQFGLPVPDAVNKGLLSALQAGGVALEDIFSSTWTSRGSMIPSIEPPWLPSYTTGSLASTYVS